MLRSRSFAAIRDAGHRVESAAQLGLGGRDDAFHLQEARRRKSPHCSPETPTTSITGGSHFTTSEILQSSSSGQGPSHRRRTSAYLHDSDEAAAEAAEKVAAAIFPGRSQ
jgi:hypothetical protein